MKTIAKLIGIFALSLLSACGGGSNGASFTGPAPDVVGPTVTASVPANAATGVLTTLPDIKVTFSEAVKPSTMVVANFTITGGTTPIVITGVTYDSATETATLILDTSASLDPSTTYTVTVTNAVTDLAGNPLTSTSLGDPGADASWTFTTA